MKVNIICENFTDCCWQRAKLFAFSVSLLEKVKPLRSLPTSLGNYLTLRAKFTMPPGKNALSTLTNLRVEHKQSAPEIGNFQRGLPKISPSSVAFSVRGVIAGHRQTVMVFFDCSVFAWRCSKYLTFRPHAVTRSCSSNQEYFGKGISSTWKSAVKCAIKTPYLDVRSREGFLCVKFL